MRGADVVFGADSDAAGGAAQAAVAEPFLEGVCWKCVFRYNHSGKKGQVNFLNGAMGVANAQRTLDYIRIITEFISQPEYRDVVPMFGIINEALMSTIGRDQLTSLYLPRGAQHDPRITGLGAGNGPFISIHDGFQGVSSWAGFLPGSDRVILDTHPYFAFDQQPNDAPIATGTDASDAGGVWPKQACSAWGPGINNRWVGSPSTGILGSVLMMMVMCGSRSAFGVTVAGEFSNGYNDCGLYLTGVNGTTHYGGDCDLWQDSSTWNATVKAGVMQFALASMDAMQDWFFWTWKVRFLSPASPAPPSITSPHADASHADRQRDGRRRALAFVVVPARARERVDADGPAHGGGHVLLPRRRERAVRRDVLGVADGRRGRGHDRGERVGAVAARGNLARRGRRGGGAAADVHRDGRGADADVRDAQCGCERGGERVDADADGVCGEWVVRRG
ncbi:glycoside hydrolase superfamily [Mycena sp. CBHHK59/15]|nr:glycoside hydrolase superfamily [Mycena sp. CBHHK59/15]